MYDVIVVGAGPAGLSAALILGRCRRRVLVCDAGRPRNAASRALHGFLGHDGINPQELLHLGREQLDQYTSVELVTTEVVTATCHDDYFEIRLHDGRKQQSRALLLATGVVDHIPDIAGAKEWYGRGVFHCPYCDGWEVRDQPLAVYGRGKSGEAVSLKLKVWSDDVVLCTDGPCELDEEQRSRLKKNRVIMREDPIARLEGSEDRLERIVFQSGESLDCRALFFSTGQEQHSPLPQQLGCTFTPAGAVETGKWETTHVTGLFVAGDASRNVQLAVIAAAEGAQAAFAINTLLQEKDELAVNC